MYAVSKFRYIAYGLVFLMALINYGDRAALSVALPQVTAAFGLSTTGAGWLLSAFFWSYFLLNLPASLLLDRLGPRTVGALSVALWSLAMVLAGFSRTLRQLVVTRVLLGAGEAPAISLGCSVIGRWAPPHERGVAMTTFMSGSSVGMAFGAIVAGVLVSGFGWRFTFSVLGVMGLVWAGIWLVCYRNPRAEGVQTPAQHYAGPFSLRALFTSPAFWGLVWAQVSANYANFLLLAWLPTYLLRVLHSDILHSGMNSAVCYLSAAVLSVALGRIAEAAMSKRRLDNGSRRFVVATYAMGAACIGLLPLFASALPILALLTLCMAFIAASFGANTALLCDLIDNGDRIASVQGVILTFSNGLGLLAPVVTGYIVQATGSFKSAFILAAVILFTGTAASLILSRGSVRTHRIAHRLSPESTFVAQS